MYGVADRCVLRTTFDPPPTLNFFTQKFNFLHSHVTGLKKLLHIAQPVIQSNLNWKIGNAQCVLTKNEHSECDAIKKRSLMPIAPGGACPLPLPPFFPIFLPFFGRWARHGCMQPAPTFVSHKQINFGRCF